MKIVHGVIINPNLDYLLGSRIQHTRKGIVIDPKHLIMTGTRETAIVKGVLFNFSSQAPAENKQGSIKIPRQEPLEHSWKKMNM
ncbi:TPA: hypothetical protein QC443_002506 [Bacillus cereus]|uniref:hypothetical protein n=1 Tax=Bacillus paranthracis TaxID=2026186 RepID=UPI0022E46DFC|nr:hypothetical protein [Bacillus paranthracis]HDR8076358.1 hypothetical protein [Bacillus cereus]MED0977856.1 hypothetical protein [Bacillus paranthracis]MED1138875.1 hypothetical protein [Bacillus paranthracis]HDR8207945.1 hypothetical protein [Bacillus cereus]HDR8224874.1 hypothetical protein [Bacillus cereus]